jgi:hypothetical protein
VQQFPCILWILDTEITVSSCIRIFDINSATYMAEHNLHTQHIVLSMDTGSSSLWHIARFNAQSYLDFVL